MQQFVFPAILYKDSENRGYTIILHDLSLCTEGETVEDAFLRAKDFLETYCKCALEFNGEVESATKFEDVENDENNIVLLVDAQIEGEGAKIKDEFNFNFD